MLATVTDKGQVTVPRNIREQLGIVPGSKLDFELMPDGSVRLCVLAHGSDNLFGLLQQPGTPRLTVEEMDEGIAQAVKARSQRPNA